MLYYLTNIYLAFIIYKEVIMLDNVKKYFEKFGKQNDIFIFNQSSATVELAAEALNAMPSDIAKSLSFYDKDGGCIMVIVAGDKKIENKKYKQTFGLKAKMLSASDVPTLTNHEIGGVCPFAVSDKVKVYLDESLKSHEYVYPACGSHNSAIKLTVDELEKYCDNFTAWVDVTND